MPKILTTRSYLGSGLRVTYMHLPHECIKLILSSLQKEGFGFRTPALSLMSTVVMMIGSVEYIDNWINPLFNGNAMLVAMRFIMLCIFIFLMPILLINLLVSDNESLDIDFGAYF